MNIWEIHSIWFLLGCAIFPRITLLFFSLTPFGWLAWIGWLFTPHLLVAFLSLSFWSENPALVILAWILAFAGTGGEARAAYR